MKMPELIRIYEMSIIPRSLFSPDGSPLLCVDKTSLMTHIIAHQPVQGQLSVAGDREKVLIIDVIVSDNFEVVRVILDRGFRHRGSKIQKSQFGIFLDNPHDFQWVIESLVNRCVCVELEVEERSK